MALLGSPFWSKNTILFLSNLLSLALIRDLTKKKDTLPLSKQKIQGRLASLKYKEMQWKKQYSVSVLGLQVNI